MESIFITIALVIALIISITFNIFQGIAQVETKNELERTLDRIKVLAEDNKRYKSLAKVKEALLIKVSTILANSKYTIPKDNNNKEVLPFGVFNIDTNETEKVTSIRFKLVENEIKVYINGQIKPINATIFLTDLTNISIRQISTAKDIIYTDTNLSLDHLIKLNNNFNI